MSDAHSYQENQEALLTDGQHLLESTPKLDLIDSVPTVDRKENFIPFRLHDLKNRLITSFPELFDPQTKDQFCEFVDRLTTFTLLRLSADMKDCIQSYTWVDPDTDLQLPVLLAGDELQLRSRDFIDQKIVGVLQDAGFLEIPRDEVEDALKNQSASGISVIPPPNHMIYYRMFQRGRVKVEKTIRNWRTLWCKKTYLETEYKRLLVLFSLNEDAADADGEDEQNSNIQIVFTKDEVKKEQNTIEIIENPWWKLWHWCSGPKQIKIRGVKADMVYMKIFKNMQVTDIDQLVPGNKVKFSVMDKLMIWVPVLFGLGVAIYKIIDGSLDFQLWIHFLTTIFLVLFPLTYGYRAYASIQQKRADLKAKLNQLFLLHNLTNNAGVLSYLIEEAEEQEDKENMIAYFFLWKHGVVPISKEDLDRIVEEFLISVMHKYGIVMRFDFDVADAIQDLIKMGLAVESSPDKYTAVDLKTAVEKVAVQNFKQTKLKNVKSGLGRSI
eukprot:TRINITY_DN3894_c1_g4_i1.p1 TRINITY_DN3894_c1_g4~~TRINITY_DN3894_c1_g4_i1.p1  ORF type:complete len:546 (+),score=65.63 TRINITY_DN3894_c1_g4_i1:152-1639(+)